MPTEPECNCPYTDPKTWFYHYGTPEPGSMQEQGENCPAHPVTYVDTDSLQDILDHVSPPPPRNV